MFRHKGIFAFQNTAKIFFVYLLYSRDMYIKGSEIPSKKCFASEARRFSRFLHVHHDDCLPMLSRFVFFLNLLYFGCKIASKLSHSDTNYIS